MKLLDSIRRMIGPAPSAPRPVRTQRSRTSADLEAQIGGIYTQIGYRAARIADRDGRPPTPGSGKINERVDRKRLQQQSREFRRDNDLYNGMLNRLRSYIVGKGFGLQCLSADPEWNELVETKWKEWWKKPESSGQHSGRRCERMVMDELLTTGEGLVLLTDLDKIQILEAEQLEGHNTSNDGIDRDGYGRPTKYWIRKYGPTGITEGVPIPHDPATVLYVADPERPSSSRAVPPGQSSFPMLHRIVDICNSEAISWQMQARLALSIKRASGLPVPGSIDSEGGDVDEDDQDPDGKFTTKLSYATLFHAGPGDEIQGIARTAPSGSFPETLRMFLRLLGLALGLPLEFMLLDWTGSNYSQSRAVVEQFFTSVCEEWQGILEEGFHVPTFVWWLQRSVARKEIPERPDQLKHAWVKPRPPWLDKLKESQANGEQVERGQTTHAAVCKSQNTDRPSVLAQLKQETIDALEIVADIKAKTGRDLPYERFCGMRAPGSPGTGAPGAPGAPGSASPPGGGTPAPGPDPAGSPKPDPANPNDEDVE